MLSEKYKIFSVFLVVLASLTYMSVKIATLLP
jgi:hypothetical protein